MAVIDENHVLEITTQDDILHFTKKTYAESYTCRSLLNEFKDPVFYSEAEVQFFMNIYPNIIRLNLNVERLKS